MVNPMENSLGATLTRPITIRLNWSIVKTILRFVIVAVFFSTVAYVWASTTPSDTVVIERSGEYASSQSPIELRFDRPISRDAVPSIIPAVEGDWTYEDFILSPHLARTLVFTPVVSLAPDTEYTISVEGVRNVLALQQDEVNVLHTFSTAPAPVVTEIFPTSSEEGVLAPSTSWIVKLSSVNDGQRSFDFVFEPATAFTATITEEKNAYVVEPLALLQQGTTYTLTVFGHDMQYYLSSGEVAVQGDPELLLSATGTTRNAPGISTVTPTGDHVTKHERISVTFTETVDPSAVEAGVRIEPALEGTWETVDELTYTYTSAQPAYGTTYTLVFAQGLPTRSGGYLPQEAVYSFTTLGAVRVDRFSPVHGSSGASVNSSIHVTFDQMVDHFSAEKVFSISPHVDGTFSWGENRMIFTPSSPLAYNTPYTVTLGAGVVSVDALDSTQAFTSTFTTQLSLVKLGVPFHRQERPLSCEAATLVMALRYRGITVSESTIIDQIGIDPTPHKDGVWGNPHIAFVGDYYGRQATTGYGVYWQPIARVANLYRTSRWFTNGTVQDLTAEIDKGNPTIVWGNAASGARADWKTPQGETVYAIVGEHTRVVIGYSGPAENPTSIITLDPLSGEKHYSRSAFESNWSTLGKAGVVVE